MRSRLLAPASVACAALAAAFALVVACSNQGEGDRCDPAAESGGSVDCTEGLVCTPLSRLGPGALGPACCPVDPSRATVSICKGPVSGGPDASVPDPGEAGLPDASVPDAGSADGGDGGGADAGSDAAADAGSDGAADAGGDADDGGL